MLRLTMEVISTHTASLPTLMYRVPARGGVLCLCRCRMQVLYAVAHTEGAYLTIVVRSNNPQQPYLAHSFLCQSRVRAQISFSCALSPGCQTHIHTYTSTHTYTQTYTHAHTQSCTYSFSYAYTRTYTQTCAAHTQSQTHTHIQSQSQSYTQSCTYTYNAHTQSQTQSCTFTYIYISAYCTHIDTNTCDIHT